MGTFYSHVLTMFDFEYDVVMLTDSKAKKKVCSDSMAKKVGYGDLVNRVNFTEKSTFPDKEYIFASITFFVSHFGRLSL